MFHTSGEFLKDVRSRIKEYITANPGKTGKQAFSELALHRWMYLFDPVSVPPLLELCRAFSKQYYANNKRLPEAKLLYETCHSKYFDVISLPKSARKVRYEDELRLTSLRQVAHAGLMVPCCIDHKNDRSAYRKLLIRLDLLTPHLFLHELAHAMEYYRVRYSDKNHDRLFCRFLRQLELFWDRAEFALPSKNFAA